MTPRKLGSFVCGISTMVILFLHFLGKQDAQKGYLRQPLRADNNVFWVCATTDHEGPPA
jgi:hypothetical protein